MDPEKFFSITTIGFAIKLKASSEGPSATLTIS
jgi:hypothetical protein